MNVSIIAIHCDQAGENLTERSWLRAGVCTKAAAKTVKIQYLDQFIFNLEILREIVESYRWSWAGLVNEAIVHKSAKYGTFAHSIFSTKDHLESWCTDGHVVPFRTCFTSSVWSVIC